MNRTRVFATTIAIGCLLAVGADALAAGAPSEKHSQPVRLERALEYCATRRTTDYVFVASAREIQHAFAGRRLESDSAYARTTADLDRRTFERSHRIFSAIVAFDSLLCLWLCSTFWRQKGVTRLERALALAAFLAIAAEGIWEALSRRADYLSSAAEAERLGIERAERTAADTRMAARWQYDRKLAAADLLYERCQSDAQAAAGDGGR